MRALLDVAHTLNGNRGGRVILKDANRQSFFHPTHSSSSSSSSSFFIDEH